MPKTPEFMKRKKLMTLEKLLIFGFALAALFAITTVGGNMLDERGKTNDRLKNNTTTLENKTF